MQREIPLFISYIWSVSIDEQKTQRMRKKMADLKHKLGLARWFAFLYIIYSQKHAYAMNFKIKFDAICCEMKTQLSELHIFST